MSNRKLFPARLIEVIEVQGVRGSGTEGDPIREVIQYWSKAGRLLAEYDVDKDGDYPDVQWRDK